MEPNPEMIEKNIRAIENQLAPFGTKLLPVSKTFGIEAIRAAYDVGYRQFGENRVQELVPKFEALPKDIEWHLIGHLQSNKVKYIAPFIGCIQSVDSEKLLSEIDKQSARHHRIIPCLLQIHIAREETKFGWNAEEVHNWIQTNGHLKFNHIRIDGLMGMASNTPDLELVKKEFQGLKNLFEELKKFEQGEKFQMKTLSMGMSGDFLIAAAEGSTLVRMGSAVFGSR